MKQRYCKISLKALTEARDYQGYDIYEFRKLFGSTKTNPHLGFSRTEFFQNSRESVQGMSISGIQQKLSLSQNKDHELIAAPEGGLYILKPSPDAYPYASENEHAAMLTGKLLGIDTAQCGLVTFQGGELAYITKRFDRNANGGKQAQEDLLQCFDLPSDSKYGKTYEEAGKLIHKVTNGKQAVVLDFVRRVMFAYLIGNDDLHLKNISVQRLPDNTSRYYDKLTPNYDCLFCDAFRSGDSGIGLLALGLLYQSSDDDEDFSDAYNYYGYYTGIDFLELARRLGLQQKPIRTFIAKLREKQDDIVQLITRSFMPEAMQQRAIKLVASRSKALQITAANQ